jgi:hypothetical protein
LADFKRLNFTSPRGVFVFPKLNEPDTKFNAEGDYTVKLSLKADAPTTKAFIAQLAPLHAEAIKAAQAKFKELKPEARKKLKEVTVNEMFVTKLDENEQPTGDIEFNFKMKASGISKKTGKRWTRKPAIFDAKGTTLKNPPSIWGGTVGKVGFSVTEGGYFVPGTGAAGISLGLEGVQIIELRSGQGRSAKEMGFGEEEGFDGSGNEFDGGEDSTADASADAAAADADF